MYDLLEPYGKVVSVRMQHVKGEAFVYFDSVNGADAAIAALHGRRTLKGRHRPLQLFYASSSAEWSWFGIMHNTRLHHFNPKVELPPFFNRKPPLASSQWALEPNTTAEATELVLPSTLQVLHTEAGPGREQKSSTSSLCTTTSSSSLYSHDSSANSSGLPSNGMRSTTGGISPPTSLKAFNGSTTTLVGLKRARQQTPLSSEGETATAATNTTAQKPSPTTTATANEEHVPRGRSPLESPSDDPRSRTHATRSHRKTKLRIEDEEAFAVLGDENGETTHRLLPLASSSEAHLAAAAPRNGEIRGSSSKADRHHHNPSNSGDGVSSSSRQCGTEDGAHTSTTSAANLLASSASFLISAETPLIEMPSVFEQSSTTATTASANLSTTVSSLEGADAVGTKNVVIRRRRAKGTGHTSLTSLSSTSRPAAAAAAARAAPASAGPLQPLITPYNFQHAARSPFSSSFSQNLALGGSPTSTASTSRNPSLAASITGAEIAAATARVFDATATPSAHHPARITTPHHHHHRHQHPKQQHGAVLPNEMLHDTLPVEFTQNTGGILGSPSAPLPGLRRSHRWTDVNAPVLASPITTAATIDAPAVRRPSPRLLLSVRTLEQEGYFAQFSRPTRRP
ncbi:putative RNA-binding protein [Leptomonas pyrrhocoris]|uniref:Putative RNA-binding protein n=1 Tax=Leptomonas pyrrhocoris TaxID=157538 RepID=A0A0M9G310_LEPPY|nr:putative RNA-binding protein [Leptomonas pyrrhocoris]KPA81197.1 putative RNA-binding protein [Leptomonas pyrrhocoris]|eukprot:XP_015659636.1 putative RNA-binding protein [Leptomonas pyrrhocoris]